VNKLATETPVGWRSSGIVSLLTDFGLADAYVGELKGVLLAHNADARFVDITHAVDPQSVTQASWLLAHAWRRFPDGTTHVAVVDPGVGTARRILVAEDGGHAFLAPDNGLLGPVLSAGARVFALDQERFALDGASHTFHGRDLFAPAAAALAAGLSPREMGEPLDDWQRAAFPAAEERADGWCTEVLHIDRFGNLITPFEVPAALRDEGPLQATACGRSMPFVSTYADVAMGDLLALLGSCGTLEISLRDGDARAALGAQIGDQVILGRTPR